MWFVGAACQKQLVGWWSWRFQSPPFTWLVFSTHVKIGYTKSYSPVVYPSSLIPTCILEISAKYIFLYRKMTGIEYWLNEVMEPHLFVFRKQKRESPDKVSPMLTYYVLDGSIYQAPQLSNVFAARIVRFYYSLLLVCAPTFSRLYAWFISSMRPINISL